MDIRENFKRTEIYLPPAPFRGLYKISNMGPDIEREYTLSDVNIVPVTISTVESRKSINVIKRTVLANGTVLHTLPLMTAPMAYFTHINAIMFLPREVIYTLPRFTASRELIVQQIMDHTTEEMHRKVKTRLVNLLTASDGDDRSLMEKDIQSLLDILYSRIDYRNIDIRIRAAEQLREAGVLFIPSVGLHEIHRYTERVVELINLSNTGMYLLDVANGYLKGIYEALEFLEQYTDMVPLFGNIVSSDILAQCSIVRRMLERDREGAEFGIRIGIGNGSECLTAINTKISRPQLSALYDIYNFAPEKNHRFIRINDGGITHYGEAVIALLFSDFIMTNYLFKGTELNIHSAFAIRKDRIPSYGMASQYIKVEDDSYIEGGLTFAQRQYIRDVVRKFIESLQSAMSYVDCRDINGFDYFNLHPRKLKLVVSGYSMRLQEGLR